MTDLEEARKRWLKEQPSYKRLGELVEARLRNEIQKSGIWADVRSRPKEIDSLIRKLLGKPHHTYDSLPDKVGIRVIVRHKAETASVLEIAGTVFRVTDVENKVARLGANVLGYLSIHANVALYESDAEFHDYPSPPFRAELQVRSLAQHLWAEMAHDSVYKNDETLQPLPDPLKRRIYILAGVVELSDEEFDRIEKDMPKLPELEILRALERNHYKLTSRRGDVQISLAVIRLLMPIYALDVPKVVAHLNEFYSREEETLRAVYVMAERTPDRSAFLFQPESLMLYDLLKANQLALRRAWNEFYPEKELERTANAFGISFD